MTGDVPPSSSVATSAPSISHTDEHTQGMLNRRMLAAPAVVGDLASLDHYRIVSRIGSGGMGVVFLAADSHSHLEVAVKTIAPELLDDQRVVDRFLDEARCMKHLGQDEVPIVPVLHIGENRTCPYFAMLYLAGGSLAQLIREGQALDTDRTARISQRVARALQYAHDRGIIHRDLKPSNILLDAQGRAYLSDFGLVHDISANQFPAGFEGTIPYMSPGVLKNEAEDVRRDIYAFGAVLYQMLTGCPPYQGGTTAELVAKILSEAPPPILKRNPTAHHGLSRIAEGCMARRLRDRYTTMADAIADLQQVERGLDPLGPHDQPRSGPSRLKFGAWMGIIALVVIVLALVVGWPYHPFNRIPRAQSASQPRMIVGEQFDGQALDSNLWHWDQTSRFSYMGLGSLNHSNVAQRDGALELNAHAQHENGWTAIQLAWADMMVPLIGQDDLRIEADFSVEGSNGDVYVELSEGDAPQDPDDADAIHLYEFKAPHYPQSARTSQAIRIDIYPTAGLAWTSAAGENRSGRYLDISRFDRCQLRFFVGASSSAGFDSGEVTVRVENVKLTRSDPSARIVGRAMNKMTNRPVAGVSVMAIPQQMQSVTNDEGYYCLELPGAEGMQVLQARMPGYEPVESELRADLTKHQTLVLDVQLRRTKFNYGDVVWAQPIEGLDAESLVVRGDQVFMIVREGDQHVLHRMQSNGLARTRLGPTDLAGGITRIKDQLCTVDCWPGRIQIIDETGQRLQERMLRMNWSRAIAFDGKLLWITEADISKDRHVIWAFNPDTLHVVATLPGTDPGLFGLAARRTASENDEANALGGVTLWISSNTSNRVYEVNAERALTAGSLDQGVVREFSGHYEQLSFDTTDGSLWGLDRVAHRICRIQTDN